MKKVESVLVFRNLQLAVFDCKGQQIPELQKIEPLAILADKAAELGFDLDGALIRVGNGVVRVVKSIDGKWNWEEP